MASGDGAVASTNLAWFARAWHTEDGLPEHTIVGLEQTPDGYLWVATHRSLSRFDGVRFQEFAPVTPAEAEQIRATLLDKRGRLWLARDGGTVICMEAGGIVKTLVLKGSANAQPRAMAEAGDGSIWISDSLGAAFRIQGEKEQQIATASGLTGPCSFATDAAGQLWFLQGGGAGVFRHERFITLTTVGHQPGRIACARRGGVWLSSGLKIFHYQDGGELKLAAELKVEPGGAEGFVTALYEDKAHALWIGTSSGGLFRLDSQGPQRVITSHPNIINLLEDSESNLWVGTRGGGLNRLSPRAVQLLEPGSGLPFATVQSACETAEGVLWAVGQNGLLAWRKGGVWELVANDAGWNGGPAACVAAQTDGSVLIGTREQGVFVHNKGSFSKPGWNSQLASPWIRSLYSGANGALWLAISSRVVRVSRDGALQNFPLPENASDVRSMIEDRAGNLWMGTTSDGRLFRIHDEMLIEETTNVMHTARHIRCLETDSDGSLWLGFAGQGLGWYKNGKFFHFRAAHGLADEFISQLLFDQRGRLWIACNRGIFQVARGELEAVAEGRATRVRSVVFGRGEGVANLQATFGICPAGARTADGRLLMPMLTGLAVIEPAVLRENPLPPPVIVERVSVNGRTVASYDAGEHTSNESAVQAKLRPGVGGLRIGPRVNRMEIEFTALSLASPENVIFRYQLLGLDEEWVEAGTSRVARYPHIPPGNYQFRVTACNHDGIWNEAGATIALNVAPSLWEATWFRVLAGLAGLTALGGAVLFVARQRYQRKLELLQQQQALERERARIAQDLHDDLGAGLVEINLGSELAQDPALEPSEVREHTREIGTRAREMVTALDEIVWAVNPKHDSVSSLATYFCQFAQHFLRTTGVRCHLQVEKDLPATPLNSEQRHSLFLAFKEALCNVVQHSGATDLWLTISIDDQGLRICVRDNGRGLDLELSPQVRSSADGLGNMRERLQRLEGSCQFASRPGQGTTVAFSIPLARNSHPAGR